MRDPNENRELSPLDRPARNNRGWGLSWPVYRNEKVVTSYSVRLTRRKIKKLHFAASLQSSTLRGNDDIGCAKLKIHQCSMNQFKHFAFVLLE